jgi:hypothetical protein
MTDLRDNTHLFEHTDEIEDQREHDTNNTDPAEDTDAPTPPGLRAWLAPDGMVKVEVTGNPTLAQLQIITSFVHQETNNMVLAGRIMDGMAALMFGGRKG